MTKYSVWWVPDLQGTPFAAEMPDEVAKSLVYICTWCGSDYAKISVYKDSFDSFPEPFSAVHGCCPSCPGNRYYLPGSLESLTLVKWPVPLEVLHYQLQIELSYFKEPTCPSNSNPPSPSLV